MLILAGTAKKKQRSVQIQNIEEMNHTHSLTATSHIVFEIEFVMVRQIQDFKTPMTTRTTLIRKLNLIK